MAAQTIETIIQTNINEYNNSRPHRSLGNLSPHAMDEAIYNFCNKGKTTRNLEVDIERDQVDNVTQRNFGRGGWCQNTGYFN